MRTAGANPCVRRCSASARCTALAQMIAAGRRVEATKNPSPVEFTTSPPWSRTPRAGHHRASEAGAPKPRRPWPRRVRRGDDVGEHERLVGDGGGGPPPGGCPNGVVGRRLIANGSQAMEPPPSLLRSPGLPRRLVRAAAAPWPGAAVTGDLVRGAHLPPVPQYACAAPVLRPSASPSARSTRPQLSCLLARSAGES